ncbi:Hsp70 protein-domain-containing protein [Pyrenochaeta sp. MPI-SDFR-AT-0127]|nr:Hsp70 protein-domain-containing protein [Pyrenochaeta sp. MPI-SDFR-AT-0127]
MVRLRRYRTKRNRSVLFFVLVVLTCGVFLARPVKSQYEPSVTGPVIGISLGNTVSCVSHATSVSSDRGWNYENKTNLPWVSCIKNKDILSDAGFKPTSHNNNPFRLIPGKTSPGLIELTRTDEFKVTTYLSVTETITPIVKHLKEIASCHLNTTVGHAVMTVPYRFGDSQREASKDIGNRAGMEVLRVVNEPTVASLAYGLDRLDGRTKSPHDERNALVFDMGGVTLDVTALSIEEGVFEILGSVENLSLGGEHVNKRWLHHTVQHFIARNNTDLRRDRDAIDKLKLEIEQGKRNLSTGDLATITVQDSFHGTTFQHNLTRFEFDSMMTPLIKEAISSMNNVLEVARLNKSMIDEVVLAGGSTNMPLVRKMIGEYFSNDDVRIHILSYLNATETIAIGAAIQGAILADDGYTGCLVGTFDVNKLSIGIEIAGGLMHPILLRGAGLPTIKSQLFTTVIDNQETMNIRVFQGERTQTKDNIFMGSLPALPLSGGKRGTAKVDVTVKVNSYQDEVEISAVDRATSNKAGLSIIVSNENRITQERYESHVEESEQHYEEDRETKQRIQAEVSASIELGDVKKIGRDSLEFVFVEWKAEQSRE